MSRNFSNFFDAYYEYARDGYVPDRFHRWIGMSIMAAAIERKITLRQGDIYHIPNLYVMLVSHPGIGKSTAINKGVDLLETIRRKHNPNFRFIPMKTTEPGILDMMKNVNRVPIPGTNKIITHSSGFFYADEAADSALNNKNTPGDVIAIMTKMYDCPKMYRKKTQSMPQAIEIENACMNLLSGSTFDFLKTLVNGQSVMGGFASRLLYVVEKEREVKETSWHGMYKKSDGFNEKLLEDLFHIHSSNKSKWKIGPLMKF